MTKRLYDQIADLALSRLESVTGIKPYTYTYEKGFFSIGDKKIKLHYEMWLLWLHICARASACGCEDPEKIADLIVLSLVVKPEKQ